MRSFSFQPGSPEQSSGGLARRIEDARHALRTRYRWAFWCILFAPALLVAFYNILIASDRYVSHAKFVVRSAAQPAQISGLSSFLRQTGIAISQDSTFAAQEFLTSRAASMQLAGQIDLKAIYGQGGIDFVASYPSLVYGDSNEELFQYLRNRISVYVLPSSGISEMTVQAFRGEDAQAVAQKLLAMAETMLNAMNERILNDSISVAQKLVRESEKRLLDTQLAIVRFQTETLLIDPTNSGVLIMETIGKLSQAVAALEAEKKEAESTSPGSPVIRSLEARIAALKDQIAKERKKIVEGEAIADQIATYERLQQERESAEKALDSAFQSLDRARLDASRQTLYLVTISAPNLPDHPEEPRRLWSIIAAFFINAIVLMIVWLIRNGLVTHGAR